jgi:hypothetical protein
MSDHFLRRGILDRESLAAAGVDPFAVDQHLMLLGQERRRGRTERRPADCNCHKNLPECVILWDHRYISMNIARRQFCQGDDRGAPSMRAWQKRQEGLQIDVIRVELRNERRARNVCVVGISPL